jgi:hypothetical protein
MGLADKLCLLRDGTVTMPAGGETGAPATAGTFIYDSMAGGAIPSTNLPVPAVIAAPNTVGGPGTALDSPMLLVVIVPATATGANAVTGTFTGGVTPTQGMTVQLQGSDDNSTWETLAQVGAQTRAGGLHSVPTASSFIVASGVYFTRFQAVRRFYRHLVPAITGTSPVLGFVIIRLELSD